MRGTDEDILFTNYLFNMTDEVGIFQHSIYGIPGLNKGYTTKMITQGR